MNIVEHDDNIVVKERNNVQQYLMRIIQRYFDNEYVETESSIEAIIVESLIRMKRDILHERSFVFSVNEKAGHVRLGLSDFNGESAFNKRTAFNKDFCVANVATNDTVCEGNDPRLNDSRDPLAHNHPSYDNFINAVQYTYKDFKGAIVKIPVGKTLKDILDQINTSANLSSHAHYNYESIIKRLRYSGARTEIDLRYIELLYSTLTGYLDDAKGLKDSLEKRSKQELQGFIDAKKKSEGYYEYAKSLAKMPPAWYDKAIQYTDDQVNGIESFCNDLIDKGVTQEEFTEFQHNLNKYVHVVAQEDDIPIGKGPIEIHDKTFIMKVVIPINISPNCGTIQRIEAYLKYNVILSTTDENGIITNTVQDLMVPISYICKESDKSYVNIKCVWHDYEGQIEIITQSKCPFSTAYTYNNESVIGISSDEMTYINALDFIDEKKADLCAITSEDKLNYIKNIIGNKECFVNGTCDYWSDSTDGTITPTWEYQIHGKFFPATYLNWDTGEPGTFNDPTAKMFLSQNGKMKIIHPFSQDRKYVLYEFNPACLAYYYDNPRISYKVYAGGE